MCTFTNSIKLLAAAIVLPSALCAQTIEVGDMTFTVVSGTQECALSKVASTATELVIPEVVSSDDAQYAVTSVASYAAQNCSALTTLVIPGSVRSIGRNSFDGCSSLESLDLPEGLTAVSSYAFNNMDLLKSVSIPSTLETLETSVFFGCEALERVDVADLGTWFRLTFPDESSNPTTFAKHLFVNGEELTVINIPESVTELKPYAFSGLASVTEVTVPASVTAIGKDAFSGCSGIQCVNTPDLAAWCNIDFAISTSNPVTSCHVLKVNGELLSEVVVPEGATTVKKYVFSGCTSISKITFPSTLTSIGNYAFYNCSGLQAIELPETLSTLGTSAFYNCSGLKSIVIPDAVTSIPNNLFYGCSALESVTFSGAITSIGQGSFRNCTSLATVVFPDNLKTIDRMAFMGCKALADITFPASLTSVGNNSFGGCGTISSIKCKAVTPPAADNYSFVSDIYAVARLEVPVGSAEAYAAADVWKEFINISESTFSGVDSIVADDADAYVVVYSLSGTVVASGKEIPAGLAPGLYIVDKGGKVAKVVIK